MPGSISRFPSTPQKLTNTRIVAAVQYLVIRHDHAHWRIKLPETAQHPVLPPLFVIALNAHGGEQLFGNANLPFAMLAGKRLAGAELTRLRHQRFGDTAGKPQVIFGAELL